LERFETREPEDLAGERADNPSNLLRPRSTVRYHKDSEALGLELSFELT
jgi:hypothetical protein